MAGMTNECNNVATRQTWIQHMTKTLKFQDQDQDFDVQDQDRDSRLTSKILEFRDWDGL